MSQIMTDLVCGMSVQPEHALSTLYSARAVYFCSEFCRSKFLEQPEKYFPALFKPGFEEAREKGISLIDAWLRPL